MTSLRLSLCASAALALGAIACQPELDDAPTASKGTLDLSRYIAVGNSLTAGFGDNGLYREGQLQSYPNILAQQFAEAGGGAFPQPLFPESQANGTGYLTLTGFDASGSPILGAATTDLALAPSTGGKVLYTKFTGEINNLGVPGLRMSQIQAPSLGNPATNGDFNALFERLSDNPTQTYLQRVAASNPSFFSCWLGNNDVLGYATSGGALPFNGSYAITPLAEFTAKNNRLMDTLTHNGAKGIVSNIPNVTAIPFFNTIGPRVKATLTASNITQMVVTTGSFPLAGSQPTRRTIEVSDIKSSTGGRQLFTLTASSYAGLIGQPSGKYWRDFSAQLRAGSAATSFLTFAYMKTAWGLDTTQAFGLSQGNPWPSTLLLDDTEQATVLQATTEFNAALRTKAEAEGLAYWDTNAYFDQLNATGVATNASNNTTAYITGNLFSLDGVHPTPRGYAVIANELIRVINAKYGSTLRGVDPNAYRGARYQ